MKKGIFAFLALIILGLGWYFLIKPQDYQINVKAKTFPGVINQSLKTWSLTIKDSKISQQGNLNHLSQTVTHGDSTFIYNWNITSLTDSTSSLKVNVIDPEHSLLNKLYIPFKDTDFEKRSRKTVIDFMENLNAHLKEIKVQVVGEEELASTFCACVEHKTSQNKKAFGMMESYPFLNTVITNNQIELNGLPFIETTHWDMERDSIAFNFCYPIVQKDSLPLIKNITYKEFAGKKSLKAIYNGNYMTSDRAWYALLDYADKNNIAVEPRPIEFFFNNPNMGGDALRWKAEVFLPIKN